MAPPYGAQLALNFDGSEVDVTWLAQSCPTASSSISGTHSIVKATSQCGETVSQLFPVYPFVQVNPQLDAHFAHA